MGNSNSSSGRGSIDDEDADNENFELTVPDEVRPRGRIGLRPGGTHSKRALKSGSLQSALSMDMENPEAERIRREFEIYRMNKENEITNMQRSEKKSQGENKRLRAELQALQRSSNRLRNEREEAMQAEQQALARAHTFELDRDKVQRQFKIFRETKEKEIQNLLRAKRDLENKLSKVAPDLLPDDRNRCTVNGTTTLANGDWWTQLDRDSSVGSTTQLHEPMMRTQEFTSSLLQLEMANGLARDVWGFPTDCMNHTTVRVFISHTEDMSDAVDSFIDKQSETIRRLVENDGHYLTIIRFPLENELQANFSDERMIGLRESYAEQSTIIVGFLGDKTNKYTLAEVNHAHLKNPGAKPTIMCMRSASSGDSEMVQLKTEVKRTGEAKMYEGYTSANEAAVANEVKSHIMSISSRLKKIMELGIDPEKLDQSDVDNYVDYVDTDNGESMCGCEIWDEHSHSEHLEVFYNAAKCSHESSLDKLFDQLNNYITAPGPSPPLLITGMPGCGKTTLLARWIQHQQIRGNAGVFLYHFVGSAQSVSADPVHMIRRLTSQLMKHAVNPPGLSCDPTRLMEEFPRWLEKVSSRVTSGVTVIIDGLDTFQNAESHLRWLLDPLPVDSRVIVTANEKTCKAAWKSWTHFKIEPLNIRGVKDLLRHGLQQKQCYLDSESEMKILTHCRTPDTCCPLYISVLSACLASIGNNLKKLHHQLDQCLGADNTVDLYLVVLDFIREQLETSDCNKGTIKKFLKMVYASRNGLGDWECMEMLPGMSWTFWGTLTRLLVEFHVIVYRSGLICIAHDQVCEAIKIKYFPEKDDNKQLDITRKQLIEYFSQFLVPGKVTCHMADELPWLHKETRNKDGVQTVLLFLCIFLRLYVRGRCNELIGYWQYLGVDKNNMADLYYNKIKFIETTMADKVEGVNMMLVSTFYEALGCFLRDLCMLKEACNPLQRALELRETTLDPDHPKVAQSLHQLASLYSQWNKFSSAEAMYKQALEIYENAYGKEHTLVAKELDAIVSLYQKQNKHQVAEPLKKRANLIRKKNRVPRIRCCSESESAKPSFPSSPKKPSMKLADLSMGPDSPELATQLNDMGVLYYMQGNHSEAESLFKSSLQMRINVLPADHIDLGQSYKNLAALYYEQKSWEKSESLYQSAIDIKLKHFAPDHVQVISVMKNLALVHKKLQKWEKAAPFYERIIQHMEKDIVKSPHLASALVNLAVTYCHTDRKAEAEPLYQQALKIYEKSHGPIHPRVAETLRNLAVLKYDQGDYEAAARLYKRATDMKEKMRKNVASRASSINSNLGLAGPKTRRVFLETLTTKHEH